MASTNCHAVNLGIFVDESGARSLNGYKAHFARILEDDRSGQPSFHVVITSVVNVTQSPVGVLNLGSNPLIQAVAIGVHTQIWRSLARRIRLSHGHCNESENYKKESYPNHVTLGFLLLLSWARMRDSVPDFITDYCYKRSLAKTNAPSRINFCHGIGPG